MKTILFLFSIAGLLFLASCSNNKTQTTSTDESNAVAIVEQTSPADQVQTVKKYQIKSGIVAFETDIVGIKGKEILYFDDYGIKELVEKYENNVLIDASLADGSTMYTIKYGKKLAYKTGVASRGVAYKFDWNEVSANDKESKANKLSNITIAGKDCESYVYKDESIITTYAGWNNICFYFEQKTEFGNSTSKAISIEENAIIAPEKFQVPEGFEVK